MAGILQADECYLLWPQCFIHVQQDVQRHYQFVLCNQQEEHLHTACQQRHAQVVASVHCPEGREDSTQEVASAHCPEGREDSTQEVASAHCPEGREDSTQEAVVYLGLAYV